MNGQHSGVSGEGGNSSYWAGVDNKIMNQIGDKRSMYRDGSSGGFVNTLFNNVFNNNLLDINRNLSGYIQGKKDAAAIISGLKRDPNDPDKIIESIKIISHSMGTAYSRGYAIALQKYVDNYNAKNKDNPLKGFQIETTVDIAAFQGCDLPADKTNVKNRYYMSGDKDGVANGKGALKNLSPNSDVPDANRIETDPGTEHGIKNYGKDKYIDQIPPSTKNGDAPPTVTPSAVTTYQ